MYCLQVIARASVQYGGIMHECVQVFSRAESEQKYCVRVQCPAKFHTSPCNKVFLAISYLHFCR